MKIFQGECPFLVAQNERTLNLYQGLLFAYWTEIIGIIEHINENILLNHLDSHFRRKLFYYYLLLG